MTPEERITVLRDQAGHYGPIAHSALFCYETANLLEEQTSQIEQLRTENDSRKVAYADAYQALGLLSTLAPHVEVDVNNPVHMAQEIVAAVREHHAIHGIMKVELGNVIQQLQTENAQLREENKELRERVGYQNQRRIAREKLHEENARLRARIAELEAQKGNDK